MSTDTTTSPGGRDDIADTLGHEAADAVEPSVDADAALNPDGTNDNVLTDAPDEPASDLTARPGNRGSPRGRGTLLTAALIALIVGGAAGYGATRLGGSEAPSAPTADPALEHRIAALEDKVSTFESAPTEASAAVAVLSGQVRSLGDTVAVLQDKLTEAETEIATLLSGGGDADGSTAVPAADLALLKSDIAALQFRIDGLATAPSAGSAPVANHAAEIAALQMSLGDQATRLDALAASVAGIEGSMTEPMAGFVLAAGQLRQRVEDGRPYAEALATIQSLAPADADLGQDFPVLAKHADDGAPTLDALQAGVADAFGSAVDAERAAQADGWFDGAVSYVEGLVDVRRIDGNVVGDDAAAVTTRAWAKVDAGEIGAALTELDALQGPAAGAVADWRDRAEQYVAVHDALDALEGRAVALVGGSGS
ncbi:MAG: hypothetical protein GDA49_08795 [Rhodospirillales bacterium]|nr:hypothetical protein [Rhodospirillales bacterium]